MGSSCPLSGCRRPKPVPLRLKHIPRELQSNRSLPTGDCRFSSPIWRIARRQRFSTRNGQRPATSRVPTRPHWITCFRAPPRSRGSLPTLSKVGDCQRRLVSALKSARIYGMLVPPRYGGLELDAHSGVRVAEGCFELAGSRAVYESSSLQRRVRDLRVAAQHFAAQPRNYVTAGAAVLTRLS